MNNKLTAVLFTVSFFLITSFLAAKEGYQINVHFINLKDTTCLLANHFGSKQYIQDTARIDSKGHAKFEGKKSLREGIYLIVMPNKRFFEIIVDNQQFFSVEADTSLDPKNMSFKDSPDNDLFYDYLRFNGNLKRQITDAQNKLNALPENKRKGSAEEQDVKKLEQQFDDYKNNVVRKYPKSLLTSVLNATSEIKIPDPPKNADGSVDSTFQYYYYKSHYFDGIDWMDYRLLRTPIIESKLDYYFSKLVLQIPDSINKEADILIPKLEADTEMFKFVVWFITHKYETAKIMGMDAVFVHMVKKYYTKEKAYWLSEADLFKIQDKAKQWDPILIGKKCRNLVLQDTSGVYQSLYSIKSDFTVLFFWDPDCGHCQKAAPKVLEFYHAYKQKGVEVIGICTEVEIDKWKKYIAEKGFDWINIADPNMKDNFRWDFDLSTTPQIFILDKDKIIIGKRLDAEQIPKFIDHEIEIRDNKKAME